MQELSHLAQIDRVLSQQSLYYLCKEVLGYKDIVPHVHGDFCHFLTHPQYGRFRQGTLPRSWFKCLTANSRMMTPLGSKTMDKVNVNDLVDSLYGSTIVEAVNAQEADVLEVTFQSGRVLTCTPHHPFYTIEGWIMAKDILNKGVFLSSQRVASIQDKDYARFCGYMAGDGCCKASQFTSISPEIVKFMSAYTQKELKSWNGKDYYIPVKATRTLPQELMCKSPEKDYPDVMEASPHFLQALFDCDGTVDKSFVGLTTASRKLAFGVQRNLQYFGIKSSVYTYASSNTQGYEGIAYQVKIFGDNINSFEEYVGFSIPQKAVKLHAVVLRSPVSRVQDVIPGEWRQFLNRGEAYKLRNAGVRIDNEYRTTKEKMRDVVSVLERPELNAFICAQWDFVNSVKPVGKQVVYHIQTQDQTFVADNLINHNTWAGTIAKSIWLTLPDEEGIYKDIFPYKGCDVRILIASNVIDNAAKMVHKIKDEWMNNERLKAAFPELIPDFNKTRWSDHAAEVKRKIKATEATYTAVGVGGSVISQHFDHIIEDDLVYAKKDDFTGMELMPSQEDIDNAIGWHKLTFSLLANPRTGCMDNIGTRWAPLDLINYIRKYEPHYKCFEIAATKKAVWPIETDEQCVWPERYDKVTLEQIFASQGPRIAETQYLNRPTSTEDRGFRIEYINRHTSFSFEYPKGIEYKTIVDLAGWGDSKGTARNVILTGARDKSNHIWISRVDAGRFDPTEVISLFRQHAKQFNSKIHIEEIQYQRAVRHFARQEMERTGDFYMIERLRYDGRKNAKELRIKSIEPIVSNGALHVLEHMKHLLEEFEFYPRSRTVDILDCIGYLLTVSKPPMQEYKQELIDPFSIEAIEKELKARAHPNSVLPTISIELDGRIVNVG